MNNSNKNAIESDNFTLPYLIEGQGIPALVFGDCTYYPKTFSQKLRKHLQLIFLSHRGFTTQKPSQVTSSFTLEELIDDMHKLQLALQLDKVVIIGHSIHALIALEYAKKYPDHVSQLILIASSPFAGPALHHAANRYFEESVCPKRKAALAKNLAALYASNSPINSNDAFIARMLAFGPMIWYKFNYDARHLWQDVVMNPMGAAIIWGPMFENYILEQQISLLNRPVFLALGRYDYWNPPHLWESRRHLFSNLTIRVFEKSGHTPQLEEPQAFDKELLSWLKHK